MKLKEKLKIYFILVFCLFRIAPASSEIKTISVIDAVNLALANNNDYKIAGLRLKEADQKINAVWGELFPVLESEAAVTRQDAEKGFMSLSDGQFDVKFVQMRFGINPGMFYNSLQLSRNAYTASKEEVKKIKSETELSVIKSYFSLILAEEMIRLRKDSLDVLKSNFKDVQNMYSTGSIPKYDLLQAKVQLNSQMPLLFEAESSYKTALDHFNYLLGTTDIYKADITVLENAVKDVSSDDMDRRIDILTSSALKNRPEIVQLKKKMEISQNKADIYDSYYLWPTFTAAGYYGMSKSDPNSTGVTTPFGSLDMTQITGDDKWQNTWQVRAAATYRWGSLFNIDSNSSFSREESLKAKETEIELTKLKRIIAINISAGYSRLHTSYLTILSQKENVDTAGEGLRIARESFSAGVIKNSDLLASELAFTSAKTGYINAVNSYYTALAEIKKEIGISDDSIIFEKVK